MLGRYRRAVVRLDSERVDHIEKRGDKYVLLSKKTGEVLGTHDTREGAEEQERAVEASKHQDAPNSPPEQGPAIGAPLTDQAPAAQTKIAPMPDGVSAGPNMQAGAMSYGARKDAQRIDVVHFDGSIERTPQGGLKMPATLTRTGVFVYTNSDGTKRREYRPPSEVFNVDSLRTLEDAPVTDLHQGMVQASSYQALTKGHARDIHQDGKFVAGTVLVQDAGLVQAVERGDRREISLGYECELDPTPGRTDEGESYDAIQTNIRYNHVALLPVGAGRAGREVGLRLDGASYAVLDEKQVLCHNEGDMKIRFDGKEYDLAVPEQKTAFEAAVAAADKARNDGATALATVTGERDQAIKDRDAARADAAALRDPKAMSLRVEKRAKLESQAREILGPDAKFDGLTNGEIREKVVLSVDATVKERLDSYVVDGQPTAGRKAYLKARFDALFASSSVGGARAAVLASQTPGFQQSNVTPAPQVTAWQGPLAMSKGN